MVKLSSYEIYYLEIEHSISRMRINFNEKIVYYKLHSLYDRVLR